MTEIIVDKIVFLKSKKYFELFYFTAYARKLDGIEIKIQGLSTPELNEVQIYCDGFCQSIDQPLPIDCPSFASVKILIN